MIRVHNDFQEYIVKPTMFPDGTSQMWKLPPNIFNSNFFGITWNFESEREIIDVLSIRKLLHNKPVYLHIPYLPYGRQDKSVNNESTFNLEVLADILNSAEFEQVTSVDVHNESRTSKLINDFKNVPVTYIHRTIIDDIKPDYVVFPDEGAKSRYPNYNVPSIACIKARNQLTGELLQHIIPMDKPISPGTKFLIIDDICDGGATFISIAKTLRELEPNISISLFVTHGIFSKGRQHLLDNGIDKIYTTTSILKNEDGYEV